MAKRWVLGAALLSLMGPGCGVPPARSTVTRAQPQPHWEDVFDGVPEFLLTLRPKAIERDGVYGRLWGGLVRTTLARYHVAGVSSLQAITGADEVAVAVHRTPEGDEVLVALVGVSADIDPAKVTDADGHLVFRWAAEGPRTVEYILADSQTEMFALPGRTWVVVNRALRERARQAFARPIGRPLLRADTEALATLRLDPNVFVRPRVGQSAALGQLLRELGGMTLRLDPGARGVLLRLTYEREDASARAESYARQLLAEFAHSDAHPVHPAHPAHSEWGWLAGARVSREGREVTATSALPASLLESLATVRTHVESTEEL